MSEQSDPEPEKPPVAPAARTRRTTRWQSHPLITAYTGEHGVYGVVLVTALIALGEKYDTDLEVLLYLAGTMVVFWLAHVYAGLVAANASPERRALPFRTRLASSARHSVGMLIAMLPPAILLTCGVAGFFSEQVAYDLALATGVIVLAAIGAANARRNGRRWPMQLLGALSTATLGLIVIALSILAH